MTLEYRLNIKHIPENTAILDVYFNNDKDDSYLKDKVPGERYDFLSYSKNRIYLDVIKSQNKFLAVKELWKTINVQNVILCLSSSLINDDNALEHILSSIIQKFFYNVYKEKGTITVTHAGTKKSPILENVLSMLDKIQLGRKISMIPANKGTPEYMAKTIQKLFKVYHVQSKILNHAYLKKHKFNLINAVGEGAKNPPCMLVVERIINKKYPTVCIVGKGITFDSGGLSIKDSRSIMSMKLDKIGAVNGSIALLHLMQLKNVNLIGLFPFAENAVSEHAVHPGDVFSSYLGKTVEILDPDAEGRLIMADALGYAHKYKPDLVIDIATLTGHADFINCWHYGYYFATPEPLKHRFEKLTDAIGERMIPMPTWTEYKEVLNSTVADLVNSPNNSCSDSYVAALFLKEFIPPDCEWIHIDLAHEYNEATNIPNGNGIRSIIYCVEDYLSRKK
jgi:leucyl aminopeptidase